MDDQKRDEYMLEILDRLARLETKIDDQVNIRDIAEEASKKADSNEGRIMDLERRAEENDQKWRVDRSEKWAMWITIIAGSFTVGASLINVFFG